METLQQRTDKLLAQMFPGTAREIAEARAKAELYFEQRTREYSAWAEKNSQMMFD